MGGTKSELALFTGNTRGEPLFKKRYLNRDFSGAEQIFQRFLGECPSRVDTGCIAIAGLVENDRASFTNLPWTITGIELATRLNMRQLLLVNDLTALSASLGHLTEAELYPVQKGTGCGGEVRGIIAPGTGLGEGMLIHHGGRTFARGTEGGHTNFAPTDEEQAALLAWMEKRKKPVCYETLIAGPGLANLYDFCREYHGMAQSPEVEAAMAGQPDRIPAIVAGGTADSPCPLCRKVIKLFLTILGSEAGNLALKLYARGGIYLGGGILPRLVHHFHFDGFLKAFRDKGVMAPMMREIPVHLILRSDAPLLGAAVLAAEEICDGTLSA